MQIAFRRMPFHDEGSNTFPLVQLLGVASNWDGGRTPRQNFDRMFSKAIYAGTVDVVGLSNPTLLEQVIRGPAYSSLTRERLFERMAKGQFRLLAELDRNERRLAASLGLNKVKELDSLFDSVLGWPLWYCLEIRNSLWEISQLGDAIIIANNHRIPYIPSPPRPDVNDAARYVSQVFPHESDEDLDMLHMGIYCLKHAEATGNLAQYILTYEALFNTYARLEFKSALAEVTWIEVLAHVNRWYRTLQVHIPILDRYGPTETMLRNWPSLTPYGINLKIGTRSGDTPFILEPVSPVSLQKQFPAISLPSSTRHIAERC